MKLVASVLVTLLGAGSALAASRFMEKRAGLQPQVVAKALAQVEDEWRAQATVFLRCGAEEISDGSCGTASEGFLKVCDTIVSSLLRASSGDRGVVKEYLAEICGEHGLHGWRRERCDSLGDSVISAMTADARFNREDLGTRDACGRFFKHFADEEHGRLEAERAAREAEAKRLAEVRAAEEKRRVEAEKKRAEEAEAAARAAKERAAKEAEAAKKEAAKAAEAARKEAEKKAQEARARAEEAKREAEAQASVAKRLAAEAAEKLKAAAGRMNTTNATARHTGTKANATASSQPVPLKAE